MDRFLLTILYHEFQLWSIFIAESFIVKLFDKGLKVLEFTIVSQTRVTEKASC